MPNRLFQRRRMCDVTSGRLDFFFGPSSLSPFLESITKTALANFLDLKAFGRWNTKTFLHQYNFCAPIWVIEQCITSPRFCHSLDRCHKGGHTDAIESNLVNDAHMSLTQVCPLRLPRILPLSFSMDFWQAALKRLYKLGQCRHFQQRNFRQANWDCLDGDLLPDGLHPLTRAALPNSSHEGRLALWHFLVQCPVPTRAGKNLHLETRQGP